MKKVISIVFVLMLILCAACTRLPPDESTTSLTSESSTSSLTETELTETSKLTTKAMASEISLYSNALSAYYNLSGNAFAGADHFTLYDINGDGTKEFLLGVEWWGGMHLIAVYAIQNGVAVLQEDFTTSPTSCAPALLFKNGSIKKDFDIDPIVHYYRFENGKLKFQTMLEDNCSPDFNRVEYRRKDRKDEFSRVITKEEYDRVIKEFEGDGQVVELDWKPLAEYGR